jgi:glutamate synthase domain-containing protein 1
MNWMELAKAGSRLTRLSDSGAILMNYVQSVMTPWDARQSQALSAGIMVPAGRRLAKVPASTSRLDIAEANITGRKAVKEF